MTTTNYSQLVIATRLHLGNASIAPSRDQIQSWVRNLQGMAESVGTSHTAIAVDVTPKLPNYDYVQAVRECAGPNTIVLPVTPWGKFVPALNALLGYAHEELHAEYILFVSAEVCASAASIRTLVDHCFSADETPDSYVLVAGAALSGHDYRDAVVPLNGRTTPWNTLAVWKVSKLMLTGFLPISDLGSNAGVEECAAIALHQQLFPQARAKLVKLQDVEWQVTFDGDDERQKWHEHKMKSKLERAHAQLELLQLVDKGRVEHC
jgi:hypothetical protein